jgi:hypothetical protein
MKHFKTLTLVIIAVCLLVAPLTAPAQIIDSWIPSEHDYGDVLLGQSELQIFTFSVQDAGLLTVFHVELQGGDADFTITSDPVSTVPSGTSFDIEVTFTPSSLGLHQATLWVVSDDTLGNAEIWIPIQGYGVTSEPGPVEEMAALLEFFEASAADGSLVGVGPGNSADNRVNAFRNMLNASNDLIAAGDYDGACEQLDVAFLKSDGLEPPPDFVGGANRDAIAAEILAVMDLLGCPQ